MIYRKNLALTLTIKVVKFDEYTYENLTLTGISDYIILVKKSSSTLPSITLNKQTVILENPVYLKYLPFLPNRRTDYGHWYIFKDNGNVSIKRSGFNYIITQNQGSDKENVYKLSGMSDLYLLFDNNSTLEIEYLFNTSKQYEGGKKKSTVLSFKSATKTKKPSLKGKSLKKKL